MPGETIYAPDQRCTNIGYATFLQDWLYLYSAFLDFFGLDFRAHLFLKIQDFEAFVEMYDTFNFVWIIESIQVFIYRGLLFHQNTGFPI